jgi:hypothetical protein
MSSNPLHREKETMESLHLVANIYVANLAVLFFSKSINIISLAQAEYSKGV